MLVLNVDWLGARRFGIYSATPISNGLPYIISFKMQFLQFLAYFNHFLALFYFFEPLDLAEFFWLFATGKV